MKNDKQFFVECRDGKKEGRVGDELYALGPNFGRKVKIKEFGNKYVHMENGDKYEMRTGALKTEHQYFHLWSSEEAFIEHRRVSSMQTSFSWVIYNTTRDRFTEAQIAEASKILGIEEELQVAMQKRGF